ncbi:sugar phosphate isomerase/epimerase [Anaerobacillus alkaliphilus]|uniref:Sugar phosphate isomerase/epimerase n=1 Tax=Anaerobacillus alkaliphilus TaxID=1548597 RepID=A0A4Q0VVR8_9BACI|nr:sugar phosphate isomerase/epimerase [Anaerobacillus alkaliphilus]RXJ02529.1 sugar phosphate isomerase/epimerase [Anaerobacillus alkaliphilus]
MSIGVLAHLCKKGTFDEVAKSVGSYQFSHVQLALWKAFDNYDFTKQGLLSPGLAKEIKEQLLKNGVSISVLGCYLHLFDRNEEERRVNIERFKEIIRYAKFFGAPVVATETGKLPLADFTEQDWLNLKATIVELVKEAEKWGVFIGIEPAEDHLIDNAVKLKKLLDEVSSSHLGVVLDPGNLITKDNLHEQDNVIEEMFQLLGEKIVAFQAKDCLLDENNEYKWVPVGEGQMNYDLILRRLREYKPHVDIILDAVKPETMKDTKDYLEKQLAKLYAK